MLNQLVIASNNQGKLDELGVLLQNIGIELIPQSSFGVAAAEENGQSFVENALIKARHASSITGLPALADDSGLVVPALGGAPGINSARYAGQHGDDQANNAKLLTAMQSLRHAKRNAYFYCAMVLILSHQDPTPVIAEGKLAGQIAAQPKGNNGFGYDSLFILPDTGTHLAQLSVAKKNRISHRSQALDRLMWHIKQGYFQK